MIYGYAFGDLQQKYLKKEGNFCKQKYFLQILQVIPKIRSESHTTLKPGVRSHGYAITAASQQAARRKRKSVIFCKNTSAANFFS